MINHGISKRKHISDWAHHQIVSKFEEWSEEDMLRGSLEQAKDLMESCQRHFKQRDQLLQGTVLKK